MYCPEHIEMILRLTTRSPGWFLVVSIVLAWDSRLLQTSASTPYGRTRDENLAENNFSSSSRRIYQPSTINPREKHFSQQVYFPQSHLSNLVQPPWFSPTSTDALRDPANVPAMINEDEAKYLGRYMKNTLSEISNTNQSPLDLASINDRAVRFEMSHQADGNVNGTHTMKQNLPQQHSDDSLMKRNDQAMTKKGRVDDVVLFKTNPPTPQRHFLPASNAHQQPINLPIKQLLNQVVHKQPILIDKWATNCITKATPKAAPCEDYLIKRLNQDATEGRTAIDVERRVCCALFWHKDCINRVVLDTCPDSSPAAADFLIGSRKLDLTLSCQRFNRDGCNSALNSIVVSRTILLVSVIAYISMTNFI